MPAQIRRELTIAQPPNRRTLRVVAEAAGTAAEMPRVSGLIGHVSNRAQGNGDVSNDQVSHADVSYDSALASRGGEWGGQRALKQARVRRRGAGGVGALQRIGSEGGAEAGRRGRRGESGVPAMLGGEDMLRQLGIVPLHELERRNGVARDAREGGVGVAAGGEEVAAGGKSLHELLQGKKVRL